MPDLNALVLFAKVAEARSFSAAARRLGMPVSTVSRRIADLERTLGVRLLERSTRMLRLTDIGTDVLAQAQRGAEVGDAVECLLSDQRSAVGGLLRLSAPPNLSDTLLAPLIGAFQIAYPEVRIQVLVTERLVDLVAEAIDLAFRVGPLRDSSLVARPLLTYRHRLVASPAYLERAAPLRTPSDLAAHRVLAFSYGGPQTHWSFVHENGRKRAVALKPHLTMNDFAGLVPALLLGTGVGDLPPIVQPQAVDDGRLVEVMPAWRFAAFDLSVVHLGRLLPRHVRLFKDHAVETAPRLFPALPR